MAKSSKLEDYWQKNNVESLLRDMTRVLAQQMPSDPAASIAQYLQNKYPKSFQNFAGSNGKTDSIRKTTTTTLQSKSVTSARCGVNVSAEKLNDSQLQCNTSNQSQNSHRSTIPTISAREHPEISIGSLMFANRVGQQVILSGKDIRSDHDILQDELLTRKKLHTPTSNVIMDDISNEVQQLETHDEPSVRQLVKYKQNIRTENKRRRHREELAELAKQIHDREEIFQQNNVAETDDKKQFETHDTELAAQPKAEEDVLNEEDVFQSRKQRFRERHKDRSLTTRTFEDGNKAPRMHGCICQVCGSVMNDEDYKRYSRQLSVQPVISSVTTNEDEDAIDDWFEPSSKISDSKSPVQWIPDQITPVPVHINPFEQNSFRTTEQTNDSTTTRHRPIIPTIVIDNGEELGHSRPIRLSESDSFVRTSTPSTKNQLSKTAGNFSFSRPVSVSPIKATSTTIAHGTE
ncbi:unnamed protein product [Adineta ricciae]|uniref:Uncharacterized protein n=1 Tax=Adineta ricciae TaxID=249248 RepID=A0A815TFB7_ADIRI|nr:unnamed protein product [Adineta ricciae]